MNFEEKLKEHEEEFKKALVSKEFIENLINKYNNKEKFTKEELINCCYMNEDGSYTVCCNDAGYCYVQTFKTFIAISNSVICSPIVELDFLDEWVHRELEKLKSENQKLKEQLKIEQQKRKR